MVLFYRMIEISPSFPIYTYIETFARKSHDNLSNKEKRSKKGK